MYVCVYVCLHTYTYICIYVYTYAYINSSSYIYVFVCIHIQFKSSEDFKGAMVPKPRKEIDASHFLPDDDRHVTSYMMGMC